MPLTSQFPTPLWSAATLALGLLASGLGAWQTTQINEQRIQQALSHEALAATQQVVDQIDHYEHGLRALRGVILTAGPELRRETVLRYHLTRDIAQEFPGARGFGFIRRVAPADQAPFLAQARASGWPAFSIRQLAPHDGERYVIQYIEPVEPNIQAIGLDIASERNRREAAQAALRSGEVRLSGPITLVQATGDPQQSFLILMPVYEDGVTPPSIPQREAQGIGWTFAPLLMKEVLASLPLDPAQIHMELHDITGADQNEAVYRNQAHPFPSSEGALSHTVDKDVFGRQWRFSFGAHPAFVRSLGLPSPALVMVSGAVLSLMAAALVGLLLMGRRRRHQLLAEQARMAALVESSADGIIGMTLDGEITSWNHAAAGIFGRGAQEAMGRQMADLLAWDSPQAAAPDLLSRIRQGEHIPHFETRLRGDDHRERHVSVSVSPIRDGQGRVVGASTTVRDISEQKAAEARILELNSGLETQVAQRTAELSRVNQLLSSVLRSASEISIIATDTQGVIRLFNAGAQRMLGYRAEDMVGKQTPATFHLAEEVHARSKELSAEYGTPIEGFQAFVHKAALEGAETREWTYVRQDGTRFPVSLVVTPNRDDTGHINGYLGVALDIGERKAVEAELAASLETTRAILNTAVNPIITINAQGRVLSINPAGERAFGYPQDEVIGRNINMLMPEPYRSAHDGYLARYLTSGQARIIGVGREVMAQRKDGQVFPVHLSVGAVGLAGEPMFVGILTDISQQRQQRSELMAARDQLLMAAKAAELGIWTWTLADNSLQWNERMFELYGLPQALQEEGLRYEHWRDRIHPDDLAATHAGIQSAIGGGGNFDQVVRIVRPDGQILHIQAAAQVERDASGTAVRVTGTNRDITAQLELESRLRQAKEQSDAANAAKSSFLANMSHEIRTPMNAVLGMLQLLRQAGLTPRQEDYVSKAQGAATSLLGLLNDLLDYSKIEAGKLELDIHPFDLEALLHDLAVVLSGNQGDKNVEMMFDIDPRLPSQLAGDRLRLQQILTNLAGNALKFTTQGQVVVSIKALALGPQTVDLCIAVRDSGIGISPTQLQHIFDGFTQAEASTTRRFGGTGLGLAITKRLVELMGGQLEVDSEPGKGSRFWFTITLHVAQSTPLTAPCTALGHPLRVLVVDDNALSRELMMRGVAAFGWHCEEADGGRQGVAQVLAARSQGTPYDVVLMDWRMPELDGLGAAGQIQQAQGTEPGPAVVMVTAYGNEILADTAQDGTPPFAGFLTKPFTPRQLADTVCRAVNAHRGQPETAATPQARSQRLAGLTVLVVEDNALNRQIASELLASEGAQVDLADGGVAGVGRVLSGHTPYDAVIMDVQMPDMDGLEATRRIRADGRFPHLPILAMTANVSQADQTACLAAGMNRHVGKPINLEELVEALGALTSSVNSRPTAPQTDPDLEPLDSLLGRFGGNLALIHRVLGSFRHSLSTSLQELEACIQAQDIPAAAAVLHTIKGSAGNMGARALSARAGELEEQLKGNDRLLAAQLLHQSTVNELQGRLFSAAQGLETLAGNAGLPQTAPGGPAVAGEAWRDRLQEILALLDARNLRAVERIEELSALSPANHRAQVERGLAQARQLDFAAAAQTVRTLLEAP